MTGFIGQDYGVYLEEDFFFPSSAVDGCSAGRQEIFFPSSRVMAVGGLMLIVYP